MLSTMENLKSYSIEDLERIIKVLKKEKDLIQYENERLKKIQIEDDFLKRMVSNGEKSYFKCHICDSIFIPLINPAITCGICGKQNCDNCTKIIQSPVAMEICRICYLDRLLQLKSGEWLQEKAQHQKPTKTKDGRSNYQRQIRENILHGRHTPEQKPRPKSQILEMSVPFETGINIDITVSNKKKSTFNLLSGSNISEIDQLYYYLKQLHAKKSMYSNYTEIPEEESATSLKSSSLDNILKSSRQPQRRYVSSRSPSHFFGDFFDENLVVSSTPNSNSPNSEPNTHLTNHLYKRRTMNPSFNIDEDLNDEHVQLRAHRRNTSNTFRSSMNSMTSNASRLSELFTNDVIIQGTILVSIEYSLKQKELKVTVKECKDLTIADTIRNRTNPYVKVALLPENNKKPCKTNILRNNVDPVFNTSFSFSIEKALLNDRTLNLSVWHDDKPKLTGLFIGEVNIPLHSIDFSAHFEDWYSLTIRENVPKVVTLFKYNGELLVNMEFKTSGKAINSLGNLNIMIRSARNLNIPSSNGSSNKNNLPNPYVELTFVDPGKTTKFRTIVKKSTSNPTWNESFTIYDKSRLSLRDCTMEIVIYHKSIFGKPIPMGKVFFTIQCSETDKKLLHNVQECKEKDVLLWRSIINEPPNIHRESFIPLRTL